MVAAVMVGQFASRILTPANVAGLRSIPGDGEPTAIVFRAGESATMRVVPVGTASFNPGIEVLDGDLMPIQTRSGGAVTADLVDGELYAIIFAGRSSDAVYSIGHLGNRRQHVGPIAPTNLLQPADVSGDGVVAPIDALMVINSMRSAAAEGESLSASAGMVDVNGDGELTPIDALLVINHIRSQAAAEPESLPLDQIRS